MKTIGAEERELEVEGVDNIDALRLVFKVIFTQIYYPQEYLTLLGLEGYSLGDIFTVSN
jgi:hypothetical protein